MKWDRFKIAKNHFGVGESMVVPSIYLDELTMTEFQESVDENTIVILPIGAVEGHGDHLPLCTDSIQPEYIAESVARKLIDDLNMNVLIAPAIRYALSNTIKTLPGTITLTFETVHKIVMEILSELIRNKIQNIVVLSGHAGRFHMAALRLAAQNVIDINPKIKIMVLSDYDIIYEHKDLGFQPGDGHAGAMETSRVMKIRPDLVKGAGKKSETYPPKYQIVADPVEYFPDGVMGDPLQASNEKGELLNEVVVKELLGLIVEMVKSE
jgi:creatinine amidohydrolase